MKRIRLMMTRRPAPPLHRIKGRRFNPLVPPVSSAPHLQGGGRCRFSGHRFVGEGSRVQFRYLVSGRAWTIL
jgi:hypothetical protein